MKKIDTVWEDSKDNVIDLSSKQYEATVTRLNEKFRTKFPNYCRKCDGWGSLWEDTTKRCDALPLNVCHRCGQSGLNEEGEGPCFSCEWSFNDGILPF